MADTVLITGTGRGLGYFLAGKYLKKGDIVYGINKSDTPEMKLLAKEYPGKFRPVKCDITSEKAVAKAAKTILKQTPAIDLLINNAGIHREKPFTATNEFDAKIVRDTFEVNAVGPFLITKYFHEAVVRGKRKVFVNISSEAGSIGTCWRDREYGYCMSKAALN
ncbi:MAG TPA: SDR family NAD(P)-dependent oxidoreductase, partial [Spirochaetota bacterium]|nr:SDR family NAD(P)-dependent oxidoreductase [Spirochaetota bacterium]